jgi:hypothetical protein
LTHRFDIDHGYLTAMASLHGNTTEKSGWILIASLETYRGCSIIPAKRQSGFNGLSTSESGKIRKIELKTIHKSDNWFAINGLAGIEKLFFDEDYWLYFAILPQNLVVCSKATPFLSKQVSRKIDENPTDYIRSWVALTKAISKDFAIKFIPRINFKVVTPIRQVVKEILREPDHHDWNGVVQSIWQLNENGKWSLLYEEK